MQKKVEFLELNMTNMLEALVAQRTDKLQFEIDKKLKVSIEIRTSRLSSRDTISRKKLRSIP